MPRAAPGFVSSKFSTSITTRRGKESHSKVKKGHVEESACGREKEELHCKLSCKGSSSEHALSCLSSVAWGKGEQRNIHKQACPAYRSVSTCVIGS